MVGGFSMVLMRWASDVEKLEMRDSSLEVAAVLRVGTSLILGCFASA